MNTGLTPFNEVGFGIPGVSTGIFTDQIEDSLGNFVSDNPDFGLYIQFHTPYKFVFIDGCFSACGSLPQAFGILKDRRNYQTTLGTKNRAFMGWYVFVPRDTIFNDTYGGFTRAFWLHWTEYTDRPLADAKWMAYQDVPVLMYPFLRVYGYDQLTWGE